MLLVATLLLPQIENHQNNRKNDYTYLKKDKPYQRQRARTPISGDERRLRVEVETTEDHENRAADRTYVYHIVSNVGSLYRGNQLPPSGSGLENGAPPSEQFPHVRSRSSGSRENDVILAPA